MTRGSALLVAVCSLAMTGGVQAEPGPQAPTVEERVIAITLPAPSVNGALKSIYVPPPEGAADSTWRFWVEMPQATAPLALRDTVSNREVGLIAAADARRGGWSPALAGGEVYFDVANEAEVAVPLLSWREATIATQTPVGALNLVEVVSSDLPLRLRRHVPGIGRLAVLKQPLSDSSPGDNSFIYCTAFLVSERHAVTARHCVDIGLEGRLAELALGYVATASEEDISRHRVTLAAGSEALDVAVLTLDPPADGAAALSLAPTDAAPDSELMVLQHFAAEPLSISDDVECLARAERFDGPITWNAEALRIETVSAALFAHGCDTTSTSSGSPVLDRRSYQLVGMHQQGFFEGEAPQNRALRVTLLRKFLEETGVLAPALHADNTMQTGGN